MSPNQRHIVQLCYLFGALGIVLGTILAVVFTFAGGPVWDDWILDARAQRAAATGVEAARPTRGTIDPKGIVTLHVEFATSDGRTHQAKIPVRGAVALAAVKGSPVMVEFDPEDPSRVRSVGGTASTFGLWVLLPLMAVPVGFSMLALGVVLSRRWRGAR